MGQAAYYIKGLYYSAVNNGSKAIEWFDKSLSISFTYMEAYREKAIALMHMNRYAEALAVLDKAITIQNGFDEGHYYRGNAWKNSNGRMKPWKRISDCPDV